VKSSRTSRLISTNCKAAAPFGAVSTRYPRARRRRKPNQASGSYIRRPCPGSDNNRARLFPFCSCSPKSFVSSLSHCLFLTVIKPCHKTSIELEAVTTLGLKETPQVLGVTVGFYNWCRSHYLAALPLKRCYTEPPPGSCPQLTIYKRNIYVLTGSLRTRAASIARTFQPYLLFCGLG
jgi:hypothetical protein